MEHLKRTPIKRKPLQSKRSKACDIPPKVRLTVLDRDKGVCVFCQMRQGFPNCHIISRAKGGLGVEQNIICACMECHNKYDNGCTREEHEQMYQQAVEHQILFYPDWEASKYVYRKWG